MASKNAPAKTRSNTSTMRANNKAKNEALRAKGVHPKQLRAKKQEEQQQINKILGRRHGHKVSETIAVLAEANYGVVFPKSLIKKGEAA